MWRRWLADPLNGKIPLSRAFWLYGVGGSVAYSIVALLFPLTPVGIFLNLSLALIVGILQSVILWRCAPNSRLPYMKRLMRVCVIVGVILLPFMLYLSLSYPSLLDPEHILDLQ